MKEGSSRVAATWWDSHRNRFVCNGKAHTATVTIDTVEKGKKGVLAPGTAWVQFCVTKGHTEKDTVLLLSKSAFRPGTVGISRCARRCPQRVESEKRTYDVQLVGPGDISGPGQYESPDGRMPQVNDVIRVDEHGGRARVTEITPGDPPLIRAELV